MGKRYTEDFRREAVELVNKGTMQAVVARRLRVSASSISLWRRQMASIVSHESTNGTVNGTASDAPTQLSPRILRETERLREENARLRKELDFWQKIARSFAARVD